MISEPEIPPTQQNQKLTAEQKKLAREIVGIFNAIKPLLARIKPGILASNSSVGIRVEKWRFEVTKLDAIIDLLTKFEIAGDFFVKDNSVRTALSRQLTLLREAASRYQNLFNDIVTIKQNPAPLVEQELFTSFPEAEKFLPTIYPLDNALEFIAANFTLLRMELVRKQNVHAIISTIKLLTTNEKLGAQLKTLDKLDTNRLDLVKKIYEEHKAKYSSQSKNYVNFHRGHKIPTKVYDESTKNMISLAQDLYCIQILIDKLQEVEGLKTNL